MRELFCLYVYIYFSFCFHLTVSVSIPPAGTRQCCSIKDIVGPKFRLLLFIANVSSAGRLKTLARFSPLPGYDGPRTVDLCNERGEGVEKNRTDRNRRRIHLLPHSSQWTVCERRGYFVSPAFPVHPLRKNPTIPSPKNISRNVSTIGGQRVGRGAIFLHGDYGITFNNNFLL